MGCQLLSYEPLHWINFCNLFCYIMPGLQMGNFSEGDFAVN